jgi:hypothetical protein
MLFDSRPFLTAHDYLCNITDNAAPLPLTHTHKHPQTLALPGQCVHQWKVCVVTSFSLHAVNLIHILPLTDGMAR